MNGRTILYVRLVQPEPEWRLYAGKTFLYASPTQEMPIEKAMELINSYPGRYEICVEDAEQRQGKRQDQVDYSFWMAVACLVGMAVVGLILLLLSTWRG